MQLPNEEQKWRGLAKCKDLTTTQADELFFFSTGGSPRKAEQFCATCPVKRECLHFAVLHNQDGVWAGTTKDERTELARFGFKTRILAQGLVTHQTFASPVPESESLTVDLKPPQPTQSFLDPKLTESDFPTVRATA